MQRSRSGFTLIELLVVITILLVMTGLTVVLVGSTMNSDRIRSSARIMQSMIAGARDRASRAGRDVTGPPIPYRGVRLNPDDPTGNEMTYSSLTYIGSTDNPNLGKVQLFFAPVEEPAGSGTWNWYPRELRGFADTSGAKPNWVSLGTAKLLTNRSQIQLDGTGPIYSLDPKYPPYSATDDGTNYYDVIQLATDYSGSAALNATPAPTTSASRPSRPYAVALNGAATVANTPFGSYTLTLAPSVLPGQGAQSLASGIAIDAMRSRLPAGWNATRSVLKTAIVPNGWVAIGPDPGDSTNTYQIIQQKAPTIDILFSPRGNLYGPSSSMGMIHFYVCETRDILNQQIIPAASSVPYGWDDAGLLPTDTTQRVILMDPANDESRDKRIVTLYTQSGQVATVDVDVSDFVTNSTGLGPKDGLADDIFTFAKQGATAGR